MNLLINPEPINFGFQTHGNVGVAPEKKIKTYIYIVVNRRTARWINDDSIRFT